MPSTACSALLAAGLHAPRRIHRGELAVEGMDAGLGRLLDRPDGAQGAHGRAEQRDTRQEQQRFLFCGRWHGPTVAAGRRASGINSLVCGSDYFGGAVLAGSVVSAVSDVSAGAVLSAVPVVVAVSAVHLDRCIHCPENLGRGCSRMVRGFSRIAAVRLDANTGDPKKRCIRGNSRSIRENPRPGFRVLWSPIPPIDFSTKSTR